MKKLYLFLFACSSFLEGRENSYSIVYVHIGQTLPSYLKVSLIQTRLFNPEAKLVLIANRTTLNNFDPSLNLTLIPLEDLPKTIEHSTFEKRTKLDTDFEHGYHKYTSERFLVLFDYMVKYHAENVFHIENDVLLYKNLQELLPVFQKYYPAIASTFESEFKCIPGFLFIKNDKSMKQLANYFAIKAHLALSDMKLLALFWKDHEEAIDCLPMIMENYLLEKSPTRFNTNAWKKKQRHCQHIEEFGAIFDGAAIGVYFDGLSPDKGNFPPGHLMKMLFNPSEIDFFWSLDEYSRKIPFARYKEKTYPIVNLHIASKRLENFTSTPK